ncbi:MAG: allophanate hydrolase subunit 1 [Candidatus Nanopelagicales bacterium]
MTPETPAGSRDVIRYSQDSFLVKCEAEAPVDFLQKIDRIGGHALEAHCGETSVLVRFDPTQTDPAELATTLETLEVDASETKRKHLRLRIRYDGPDLADIAAATDLSIGQVITLHSQATYQVAFAGFSPGFAYLTGLPKQLHLPRRNTPRARVPAGSLAIAAHYCAIYPNSTPGGWHLLGTSNAELFNPDRNPPALLRPGTSITFEPVQ